LQLPETLKDGADHHNALSASQQRRDVWRQQGGGQDGPAEVLEQAEQQQAAATGQGQGRRRWGQQHQWRRRHRQQQQRGCQRRGQERQAQLAAHAGAAHQRTRGLSSQGEQGTTHLRRPR